MGSESKGGVEFIQIDKIYEFCAPQFFDFLNEESEEEIKRAENWFEISQSYAPSPFMLKIKEGRAIQIDSLCEFGSAEKTQKGLNKQRDDSSTVAEKPRDGQDLIIAQQEMNDCKMSFEFEKNSSSSSFPLDTTSKETTSFAFPILPSADMAASSAVNLSATTNASKAAASGPNGTINQRASEASTSKTRRISSKGVTSSNSAKNHTAKKIASLISSKGVTSSNSAKNHTAKKIASLIKQTSEAKVKDKTTCVQSSKVTKPKSVITCHGIATAKKNAIAIDIAQENQAIKRQKLDCGKSRQILNVNTRVMHHKSKHELAGCVVFGGRRKESSACKENAASTIQRRPKLKLTRPKEPDFETAQRVRAVRVKSSAELEEEMLAKIPKFKARPLNKKILEALPPLPKSTPQLPEFKEFHLKTMERANQHAETSFVVSSLNDSQNHRPRHLETLLRARPPKIKSSKEMELEELEKIPKFKARPLNKKILESKGDLGLFTIPKPQITTPQEFHFATDERLGPPLAVTEMFDKLSLHSESSSQHNHHDIPRTTIPNPFHLHTEERGLQKERQFMVQILQKQTEGEKARIPKATPYPYTTDYPVVPAKPEPKQCTKAEAFQLESLIRHEEEMQIKMEERERMEREEVQRRLFKAQPILREDSIPLPRKERKPLTDVQEFVLHVGHRAVERSEFDKKMKGKKMVYKRLREEYETAKMFEEEKVVKQMRREMVPHARHLPKFDNPFLPQRSTKDLTKAKSPILRVKQREERRRHAFLR